MFRKIRKGDKIVYYAAGSYVILGIFTVKSDMEYYSDKIWPNVFVRKIEPDLLPPKGKYLHIKKLLFESNYTFDVFPNKRLWHTALRGKTLKRLTKADYDKFGRNLSESRFLVSRDKTRRPQLVLVTPRGVALINCSQPTIFTLVTWTGWRGRIWCILVRH